MSKHSIKNSKPGRAFNRFSANHPKLGIAFNGAVENIARRVNLFKDSAFISTFGTMTGMHAVAAGATLAVVLPHVVIAAVSAATAAVLVDGVIGARRALNAEKARKGFHRQPSRLALAFKAFNAACDQRLEKLFTNHPGLAAATGASGATTAFAAMGMAPMTAPVSSAFAALRARHNNRATL